MDNFDVINRIDELEREIAALPQGGIAIKRVRGKEYYYHRIITTWRVCITAAKQ